MFHVSMGGLLFRWRASFLSGGGMPMGSISFGGREGFEKSRKMRGGAPHTPHPHYEKPSKESSHNQKQLFYIEETMNSSRKQNKKSCQFKFLNNLSAHSGSL